MGDVAGGSSKLMVDVVESSMGDVAKGLVEVAVLIDGIESTGELGDSWPVDCQQCSIE